MFGDSRDDVLARAIIEAAYLGDGASHEAIARRFHLSRSAYFRRLQSATQPRRVRTRRSRSRRTPPLTDAPPIDTPSTPVAKSGGSRHWNCEIAPLALFPGLFTGLSVHARFDTSIPKGFCPPGRPSCPSTITA